MKKLVSLILSLIAVVCCFASCKEENFVYYDYANLDDYISVSQYKGVEFPKSSTEIINKIQEKYHSDMQSYNLHSSVKIEKNEKVKKGDTANIDYVGKKDGVTFDGGTANGYNLVIGSGQFIDGFEDGLIGVAVGSTVDLNLTFPEDYKNAELAGQKVVFTVKVNYITRNVYPTLASVGEAMAHEMGFESLKAYEESVENSIKTDYVWTKKVVELSTVAKYPEKELNKNTDYFNLMYQSLVSTYGQDAVNTAVSTSSKNRTKEELVGYYIVKKENLTIDNEELVKKATDTYGADYTQAELQNVRLSLTMQKAIDFVIENAVVK